MKRIAIMTGGGDCAGINAFIAAAVRHGILKYGAEFVGIRKAYEGAVSDRIADYLLPLTLDGVKGLECCPSTILESSRSFPFSRENTAKGLPEKLIANLRSLGIEAVLSTGGNDTIKTGMLLSTRGFPVICAPKSIDNDVSGTDTMLGFKTAVAFGAEAVRSTINSARTHRRISVVEVMGREAGWLALEIGMAASADLILIPERPVSLERVCAAVQRIYEQQNNVNIVIAEGVRFAADDPVLNKAKAESQVVRALLEENLGTDCHGNCKLGGVGQILRRIIKIQLGLAKLEEVRCTDLGFSLRGLPPVAEDINLGTRFGIAAVDRLYAGESGIMVGIQGPRVVSVQIEQALVHKGVDWDDDELRSVGVIW